MCLLPTQLPIVLAPGRGGREEAVKGEVRVRKLRPRRHILHVQLSWEQSKTALDMLGPRIGIKPRSGRKEPSSDKLSFRIGEENLKPNSTSEIANGKRGESVGSFGVSP